MKLAATIGQRLPAFSTASGKAILAFLPQEKVKEILEKGMPLYTPSTIPAQDAFLENMKLTSLKGYSLSLQEIEDGINAVAAPILDSDRFPVASISVAGPAYRLSKERMEQIGPEIVSIASAISKDLGFIKNGSLKFNKQSRN